MMPSLPGPLLRSLPAIYHPLEELGQLIALFETVLFETESEPAAATQRWHSLDEKKSLAGAISAISSLFDASQTPREFLPWLAQWVALTHLHGLTEERQRQLLAAIVPLYAKRGTKSYLEELLAFFIPENATVTIDDQQQLGFVVGNARLGIDSRLDTEQPFWFTVNVRVLGPGGRPEDQDELSTQLEQRLRQVIDLAKPAHTLYELECQFDENTHHT